MKGPGCSRDIFPSRTAGGVIRYCLLVWAELLRFLSHLIRHFEFCWRVLRLSCSSWKVPSLDCRFYPCKLATIEEECLSRKEGTLELARESVSCKHALWAIVIALVSQQRVKMAHSEVRPHFVCFSLVMAGNQTVVSPSGTPGPVKLVLIFISCSLTRGEFFDGSQFVC